MPEHDPATGRTPLPAAEAYRLWAPTYDAENAVTTLEDAAVRSLTPHLGNALLLDAACGTGRRLPRDAAFAVGIDLVFTMLAHARARVAAHGQAALVCGDVRALPARAACFDIVWCRLAVGHLPELTAVYGELARVARAGAHIIVSDFHPAAARGGHVRTFRDAHGAVHAVEHHVHDFPEHLDAARAAGLTSSALVEPRVGPAVRHFYERADRLGAYAEQEGLPLVLVLGFRA